MGDLDRRGDAVEQDDLVGPVELVGFARRKAERHEGGGGHGGMGAPPSLGVAAHRVIAALVAEISQRLENPDQREPLARRLLAVLLEQAFQILRPAPEFGPRLNLALIIERGLARAQNLADRVARDFQIARDLLDGFALVGMLTPNPANRLHNQHSPSAPLAMQCGWLIQPNGRGVNFGSRSPGSRGENWGLTQF